MFTSGPSSFRFEFSTKFLEMPLQIGQVEMWESNTQVRPKTELLNLSAIDNLISHACLSGIKEAASL